MDKLRCPYFDLLIRKLVDSYHRMEDRDILGLLAGIEVPDEIFGIHLAMAEHRESCYLCRMMDRTPAAEKSGFLAPGQRVQPIR